MRPDIPTCKKPTDPKSIYVRCVYHTFFWGPFKDEQAVIKAIKALDKADPYWDYDSFCIIYGASPLPKDFVGGFPFVDDEMRSRIENSREKK